MSFNTKIAVIGDIHLGIRQNSQMWHDIAHNWADWFITDLHKRGIQDIIICGDFMHSRSEIAVNTLHAAADLLKKFRNFNVHILLGNHDIFYRDRTDVHSLNIVSEWPFVTVYDEVTVVYTNNGKKLCFVPWNTPLEEIPECDIMFGHFEITSFMMTQGKVCEKGVMPGDLLKKTDLIFTGHFHLSSERKYDSGTILYTGNPFEMDYGDTDNSKGYYILNTSSNEYRFISNKVSPKHKKLRLSELISLKTVTDEVKYAFNNNIVKLIIDRNVTYNDLNTLLQVYRNLNPVSLACDFEINKKKVCEEHEHIDLSGVDTKEAIEEFTKLLDYEYTDELNAVLFEIHDEVRDEKS